MNSFFRRLRWLTQRSNKEAELREELHFHLEEEAEQRKGEGLQEEDALRAARRELGNLTSLQESTRAMWGWTFLEQLVQDLCAARKQSVYQPALRNAAPGHRISGQDVAVDHGDGPVAFCEDPGGQQSAHACAENYRSFT